MIRRRLLLAEDDADDRDIFKDFLKDRQDILLLPFVENGIEVFAFLDSINNVDLLPDLLILDHNMPKLNGKQTLELLKSSNKYVHIPVVIYSTYADEQLTDICTKSGAIMVVSKPLTQAGYHLLIDECLKTINV